MKNFFKNNHTDLLNIYFTAGYPNLHDTVPIIQALDNAGADLIEVGMPYSDPMADGPTIQQSGMQALQNGMTLDVLFKQLLSVKGKVSTPLILMGYFNQMMQYGEEAFLQQCQEVGVAALILPDLPPDIYEQSYRQLFEKYQLDIVFLITPQTSDARIRKIDELSHAFIYMVSSNSITGKSGGISPKQIAYFQRIHDMNLTNPRLIGFGISDHDTYRTACDYAHGAIIGSAFIRALGAKTNTGLKEKIAEFVKSIKYDQVS